MLPDAAAPASMMTLLAAFAPLFTAPSFRTFTGLACGFLAQGGKRTVCGMLSGAGLAPVAARPGALVLLPRPAERRRPGPGRCPAGGISAGPGGGAGRRRRRRHSFQ